MCRNIRPLFNYDPPTTDDEIRASALQYVRKVSGFTRPSKVNEETFNHAVNGITEVTKELVGSLVTSAATRNREAEIEKARERARQRYG